MKQILLKNSIKCKTNGNCNTFDVGSLFEFKWAKKKNQEEFPTESLNCKENYMMQNKLYLLNNLQASIILILL